MVLPWKKKYAMSGLMEELETILSETTKKTLTKVFLVFARTEEELKDAIAELDGITEEVSMQARELAVLLKFGLQHLVDHPEENLEEMPE